MTVASRAGMMAVMTEARTTDVEQEGLTSVTMSTDMLVQERQVAVSDVGQEGHSQTIASDVGQGGSMSC